MKHFIEAIISAFRENDRLQLRILITSRVEEHIRETLETSASRSVVHRLSLGDFNARADIRAFFQSRLSTIYEKRRRVMEDLSPQWPSQSDLDFLVKKSDGSFLWATTLIKLVDGQGFPEDNLRKAFTAKEGLDGLYAQVLTDAPRDENFDRVINTIMLLAEPIPIVFLAHLLELRPKDIVQASLGLQSILMIPGSDDEPIRLFHTSLRDFLTSPERSHDLYINPSARHLFIAANCLRVLANRPTDDIFCGDREMYPCFHWCHHFVRGVTEAGEDLPSLLSQMSLMSLLTDFVSESLDVWVNTSLLRWGEHIYALGPVVSDLRVRLMLYWFEYFNFKRWSSHRLYDTSRRLFCRL